MPPRPANPIIPVPPAWTKTVKVEVEKKVRDRLGIPAAQPLPPNLVALVNSKVDAATQARLDVAVGQDVDGAIREASRGVMFAKFTDKVGAARAGIDFIAQSNDVTEILKRRAEMLWAKRKALETAGFAGAEAMQIILGDIAARGQQ
jgi:hypothetical protein